MTSAILASVLYVAVTLVITLGLARIAEGLGVETAVAATPVGAYVVAMTAIFVAIQWMGVIS